MGPGRPGRLAAVVLAFGSACQSASALKRRWGLSRAGDDEPRLDARSSAGADVEGRQEPAPRLEAARVSPDDDRRSSRRTSLLSLDSRPTTNNFTIRAVPGLMAGLEFFTKALTKDLDVELASQLAKCPLATFGGRPPTDKGAKDWPRGDVPPGRVWIFPNGETSMGYQFWDEVKSFLLPGDKGVILGNWWNETHEEFHSPEISSIWVPFASTSFAERKYFTPLDLWDRSRTHFDNKTHLVAYQQHGCNNERDDFWDALNMVSIQYLNGTRGSAIGKCNGHLKLGNRVELPEGFLDGPYPFSGHMDASVGRYEPFRFVFASEHGQNFHGYTTEKIVNAFLAGAVPIHMGAKQEQLERIFKPDTFIWTTVRNREDLDGSLHLYTALATNPEWYEKFLHRNESIVTRESMKRFFSWHPAVWPYFGDELRQRILRTALKLCRQMPAASADK